MSSGVLELRWGKTGRQEGSSLGRTVTPGRRGSHQKGNCQIQDAEQTGLKR